ncbi:MAG TPA: hypothetical protein VL986_09855 [Terracidiphilus sp.]|nr:hypothetical protein [Terracidiphilus sp.]
MQLPSPSSTLKDLIAQVHANYAALMSFASANGLDHLGGKLLCVGELDEAGRALTIAANIAGAATLATTANQTAGKQAMREGVADFVVTTLDEALRILKNQLRKREPVSVCVGKAPEIVVREMLARGVNPDLIAGGEAGESAPLVRFVAYGAQRIETQPLASGQNLFAVETPVALMRETARIEEILAAALAEDDRVNRRWLRLSPRYLGPAARRVRSMVCDASTASALREQLERLKS